MARPDYELQPSGEPYKVYGLLDELLPQALTQQRAGVSVDVRVYARRKPNGELWGEVAFIERLSGKLLAPNGTAADAIPLAIPEHVQQWLASMVERMFDAVGEA